MSVEPTVGNDDRDEVSGLSAHWPPSEMGESAEPASDRRTLIVMGRVAEHDGSEHALRTADAVAKLRRGLTARSSVAESCGLEVGRAVEAVDDLLDGKSREQDLDQSVLLIAASWCLAELACLEELDQESQGAAPGSRRDPHPASRGGRSSKSGHDGLRAGVGWMNP